MLIRNQYSGAIAVPKLTSWDPEFPACLQKLMDERNLTASDAARMIWGTYVDERGYTVPKNRQQLSRYLAGKSYPSDHTKKIMIEALRVDFKDLFPNENPINRPGSGIHLHEINDHEAVVEIHACVPTDVALEIIRLVSKGRTREDATPSI